MVRVSIWRAAHDRKLTSVRLATDRLRFGCWFCVVNRSSVERSLSGLVLRSSKSIGVFLFFFYGQLSNQNPAILF